MGTIKDLVDLITQFSDRSKDRETAALAGQIHSLLIQIQSENFQLQNETLELKKQLAECQKEREHLEKKMNEKPVGDRCPFCLVPAGRLLEIQPHKTFSDLGVKTGYYKCGECQREYDKELKD